MATSWPCEIQLTRQLVRKMIANKNSMPVHGRSRRWAEAAKRDDHAGSYSR